ncbi:hypothetical protein JCM8208_005053 [Rhodotorula glutinis]
MAAAHPTEPDPPLDPAHHHPHLDRAAFVPWPSTREWLYSLPLPPGCTAQPEPQTPEDWALVEQYRLLVNGLVVLGEYERERRRREHRGEDPFATAWDPRTCNDPVVLAAVDSLVKDTWPGSPGLDAAFPARDASGALLLGPDAPYESDAAYLGALSAVQAALGGSAAGVLRPRGSSPSTATTASSHSSRAPHHHQRPQPRSASSSSSAAAAFHDDYSTAASSAAPSFRLDPATGDMIASLPLSLSDLASLPSHSALALDPSQIPADGILADHLPLDLTGPASLPSLMGAIAELEQCVARLSLEANEARTLQKTLRMEMAARTSGAGGGAGAAEGGAAPGAARAAAKKKKRKAKKRAAAEAAAAAASAASSGQPHEHEHEHEHEHDEGDDEFDDEPQPPLTRDEALVSGLSGRVDDCCSECGESHAAVPPHHAGAGASSGAAPLVTGSGAGSGGSIIAGSAHRAVGVGAWEDGELMKALQSVSQLDRRADEYRERLRVLKEQIHHHAALADSLAAAPPSTNGHGRGALVQGQLAGEGVAEGLWPVDAEGDMYELDEEEEEEEEEMSDEAEE